MMTAFRGWSLGCVVSGALLSTVSVQADDGEGVVRMGARPAAGVVRISDDGLQSRIVRGQSEIEPTAGQSIQQEDLTQMSHCEAENCPPATAQCPDSYVVENGHVGLPWKIASWIHNDFARKGAWIRGKCGHGDGSGGGHGHCGHDGPGRPLAGCYHIVYPVDPGYFDQRDGQVYAAPGYGGPVSVPLAPVVNHTYNYGWGIPSSRLTPVLHPVTQAPVSQIPSPYPTAPVSY
ncbi:hypothetical protein SH661x_000846 [Planctomicrobium sp. SH661]|uniref:hypothetical protein n=1 Tax=Planctomicrobium sp. SH661 TaxID=3448124 RepID=UPI003F5B8EAA